MTSTLTVTVNFALFRLLLPLTLVASWVFRYNAFSFLYLVYSVLLPLCSLPDPKSMAGCTGHYLKSLIVVSSLTTLAQAVFQLTVVGLGPDSDTVLLLSNCTFEESLARQLGIQRLDNVAAELVVAKVLPDIVVLLVAIATFVTCHLLIKRDHTHENRLPTGATGSIQRADARAPRYSTFTRLVSTFENFLLVLFIALSAIIVPSAISAVYFVAFLTVATVWALNVKAAKIYRYAMVVLLLYAVTHLVVLYLYQFEFFQDAAPHLEFTTRLVGLTGILRTDCRAPADFLLWYNGNVPWMYYVNPAFIYILITILGHHLRLWYYGQDRYTLLEESPSSRKGKSRRHESDSEKQVLPDEDAPPTECLVTGGNTSTNYNSIEQDGGTASGTDSEVADAGKTDKPIEEPQSKSLASNFLDFCMNQSYLLALIAMMAWSIAFISWLTFVLLLIACLIWITPKPRLVCHILSPFLVLYTECLLIGQFIYSFNLDPELPRKSGDYNMNEIGFKKFTYPCLQLAVQIIFTAMMWLTLRQFIIQRRRPQHDSLLPMEPIHRGSQSSVSPTFASVFSHYIWKLLCKYWIFVCCGMTLLISVQGAVIYRLIYMAFLLYFIFIFQVWNWFWRKTMYVFWWVVIIYSMVVLVILYTYQFVEFREWWSDGTGWSNDTLLDIGLEQFDSAGLFVKLLTPTSFIVIVIIQVHYFHKDFLRLSDVNRYRKELPPVDDTMDETEGASDEGGEETSAKKTVPDKPKTLHLTDHDTLKDSEVTFKLNSAEQLLLLLRHTIDCCGRYWAKFSQLLFCLLEIHILKLVVFTIFIICCTEVSAVSAVYVIFIGIFLPIWKLHPIFSHLAQFWTAVVILAKMAYQLRIVDADQWQTYCIDDTNSSSPSISNSTIDNAEWAGLIKVDHMARYIKNYLGIMLILVLEAIIKLHEAQKYSDPQKERPPHGITFPETRREDADSGVLSCIKFFVNYTFYKFGLEMCYVMFAIAVCVRVDAFAVIYAVILGILLCLSRRGNAYVWPAVVILLAILLPVQYLSALGLPAGLCIKYPWLGVITQNLETWLFLPDYKYPPNVFKLLADLFLLLGVCLQAWVFLTEMSDANMRAYGGGDNKNILPEVEANSEILVPDFTVRNRTFLDGVKSFVFCYMFWVTMVIMFVTGTSRINLFSMGYVIAVFAFMWFGQEFLLKPLRRMVRMWNGLIGYCFFVLLAKACLQLVGCVYIGVLFENCCWLVQLLGITCLSPDASYAPTTVSQSCPVAADNSGLTWDVVCFTFLLLQRRIYLSHYFRHVVIDLQAQSRLASRGADLINRILIRKSAKLREEEKQVLDGIKHKMKLIKERQAKVKKGYKDSEDHFQVIRGGDYYMFDNVDEDAIPEEQPDPNTITFGMTSDGEHQPDPLKLITTALDSGTKKAVDQVESPDDDPSSYATAHAPTQSEMTSPGSESEGTTLLQEKVEEKEPSPTVYEKIKNLFKFLAALFVSFVDWIISVFNEISTNYRYVAHKLQEDKEIEKAEIQAERMRVVDAGETNGDGDGDLPGPSGDADGGNLVEVKIEDIEPSTSTALQTCESVDSLDKFEAATTSSRDKSQVYRLVEATYYLLISQSALLCYFLMILSPIVYGSLISLPYPFLVFLWAMLSVPRPSKFFWITVITYTEVIVVIKYLFQFQFFPWNDGIPNTDPFWPPRILGVERMRNYANVDIALLLALFIHRSLLKRYGLWRDAYHMSKDVEKADCDDQTEVKRSSIEDAEDGHPSLEAGDGTVSVGAVDDSCKNGDCDKKRKKPVSSFLDPFRNFYKQMTDPTFSATTDVYTLMLLCDIINFLILVFGYWAFGPALSTAGNVSSYLSENRIPVPFLLMLLTQFFMIIIDRGLYLKKNVFGKFVYQIILVILIHILIFFILPRATHRSFTNNTPAQLFYFIKCIYFCLSAYQIRSGYPTRILGNFLTKKYNYLNLFLFQGFLAIPFILEMRSLMDWMWTDTTLSIGGWLLMEDIYANIFILKCWRTNEEKYPTPRGNKKRALIKYVVGGLLLILIIFIIWFPLMLFSFLNTVYVANPPVECRITVAVGGYDPIFSINAQQGIMHKFDSASYDQLKKGKDLNSLAFINLFKPEDITAITITGQSTAVWGISPPSLKKLKTALNSTQRLRLEFYIAFTRENVTNDVSETIANTFYSTLQPSSKRQLLSALNDLQANTSSPVILHDLYPPYLRLRKSGKPLELDMLSDGRRNVSAKLEKGSIPGLTGGSEWWTLRDPESDNIVIVTFNDRIAPSALSAIAGYGIIGLYVSFILLIGKLLRGATTGMYRNVMYKWLPFVDRVLQLCLDIYLVREMREYRLEEDLYARLIFLYRSPETMVKYTYLPASKIKYKID